MKDPFCTADQYHIVPLHKHTANWDQIFARCNTAPDKSAAAARHHRTGLDSLRCEEDSESLRQDSEDAEPRKVVKRRRRKMGW